MKDRTTVVSDYNNISDELLKKVPKLKRGQTAKYRVAGSYNPKTKKYHLVSSMHIPATDTIYDPGHDDWINIAMIDRVSADGKPQFIDLWIDEQTNNTIILNGSHNRDRKIYQFFELCNFNATNPNRDPSAPKIIEKIDDVANYLAEHEKSERRRAALDMVREWTDDQIIEYWERIDPSTRVSLKASNGKGIDEKYFKYLKARLFDIAEENPEKFVTAQYSGTKTPDEIAGIITRAKDLGLFKLSSKMGKFYWPDGRELLSYKKDFGVRPYEKLKEYFLKDPQGRKDFELIRSEFE